METEGDLFLCYSQEIQRA